VAFGVRLVHSWADWGCKFFAPRMWTCPDGARLLRRVAPRYRAPNVMFHKNKMGLIIRYNGIVFYSLLYLNSWQGFDALTYMYSVIPAIVDSLPGNTKNRESTRSWTAKMRLVHSWADVHPHLMSRCDYVWWTF